MKKIIVIVCWCILALSLAACGDTYTGKIAVKGHEPFVYLVLVTDYGEMKITGPLTKKLRDCCQGKRVTLRGIAGPHEKKFMRMTELEVKEKIGR